jgi:hypothetical protein
MARSQIGPAVEPLYPWRALLLGNGLSTHISRDFAYASLYDQACAGSRHGRLADEDRALFDKFGTENFETVLGNLNVSIQAAEALGLDTAPLLARYKSVQEALGGAVRAVHLLQAEVPTKALDAIKHQLTEQAAVFTTSYDLLIYWAMGHPDGSYGPLVDCFWSAGSSFDPTNATIYPGYTAVWFLHGGLHLVVMSDGSTRKVRATGLETILDQFGKPIYGDDHARPLLITEGSYHDKRRAIEGNDYLGHALEQFKACDKPLVIFGSALANQDRHLLEAINEYPDRPVAVSLLPAKTRDVRAKQADIRGRLDAHELYFFNAESHPLGRSDLRKRPTLWRPFRKRV